MLGDNSGGECNAPDGVFSQVAGGGGHYTAFGKMGQSNAGARYLWTNSASEWHLCANRWWMKFPFARDDGEIICWGRNIEGQCVPPAGPFLQVAAGGQHCVGLRENGTVVCWGRNDQGQTDAPDGNFTQVNAFGLHSLAIRGPEFGACCTGNQLQCVITTEEKCDPVLGLTWLGAGSTCTPDSVPPPVRVTQPEMGSLLQQLDFTPQQLGPLRAEPH